jgi:hypothetical protein
MTEFKSAYQSFKPLVVAIAPKFQLSQSDFPQIIGTGFFVSSDGLVCTCRHVVDAFQNLPKPPDYEGIPADVLVFIETEHRGKKTWGWFGIDIVSVGHAALIGEPEGYVGPNPPDISFLLVAATETPTVFFSADPIVEGEFVAFPGFPMGTQLLKAPGWLHQIGPTLHSGVVSAVLPHSAVDVPHGFIVHAQTQGGASGSPVFRPNGEVVGMVYMGIKEDYYYSSPDGSGAVVYQVPTSLTGCVPREAIEAVLAFASARTAAFTGRPTLQSLINSAQQTPMDGSGIFEPYSTDGT